MQEEKIIEALNARLAESMGSADPVTMHCGEIGTIA